MVASVRHLRPTRRGYAVATIAVVALVLGATAGARSLNAVVVPAIVGLVAGAVQLAAADVPTLRRSDPHPGFPGETREVTVTVSSAVPCTVTEAVATELAVDGGNHAPSFDVGHGGSVSYRVGLTSRGGYRIGPATCRQTDSLGLFARRVSASEASANDGGHTLDLGRWTVQERLPAVEPDDGREVVVYPDVHPVETADLAAVVERLLGSERTSFDSLREFTPGDTMRDIHWRASAKRPDEEFVVTEYRGRSETTHVEIVGEAGVGGADAMATTVASVATHLQDAGATVAVTVPRGRVVAHPGQTATLLRLLALTGDGRVEEGARSRADVAVRGTGGSATVTIDDREIEFAALSGEARDREVAT